MASYADRLRVLPQFKPAEQDWLAGILFGRLESRLAHWHPEQVELELGVKERGTRSQRTVLECSIAGHPKLVATSTEQDVDRAAAEVRDELWQQIERLVTKRSVQKH
jgi:ribosome-associated translation inhibitor RaiA